MVHRWSLTSTLRRRTTYGDGVHCARAVHVQVNLVLLQAERLEQRSMDVIHATIADRTDATRCYTILGLRTSQCTRCTRRRGPCCTSWGPPSQGSVELETQNLVDRWSFIRTIYSPTTSGNGLHGARAVHVQVNLALLRAKSIAERSSPNRDRLRKALQRSLLHSEQ